MRGSKGCILDLADNYGVLGLRAERDVLRLYLYGLVKELLVECVILVIVFAVSYIESVIPGPCVQHSILFVRAA